MQAADLVTLYKYNDWANRRILTAAAKLTPEQFLAETSLSWGSVRDVLVHMLGAEWIWRMRLQHGAAPTELLRPPDFPTYDSLVERWRAEQEELGAYVAGLLDDEVNRPVLVSQHQGAGIRGRAVADPGARSQPRHAAPRRGGARVDELRLLAGRYRFDYVCARAVAPYVFWGYGQVQTRTTAATRDWQRSCGTARMGCTVSGLNKVATLLTVNICTFSM